MLFLASIILVSCNSSTKVSIETDDPLNDPLVDLDGDGSPHMIDKPGGGEVL